MVAAGALIAGVLERNLGDLGGVSGFLALRRTVSASSRKLTLAHLISRR